MRGTAHKKANSIWRGDTRKETFIDGVFTKQENSTREGRKYMVGTYRCDCGTRHYGFRIGTEKQRQVSRLCNKCFLKKYEKKRPPKVALLHRNMSKKDIENLNRYYEVKGVKITTIQK